MNTEFTSCNIILGDMPYPERTLEAVQMQIWFNNNVVSYVNEFHICIYDTPASSMFTSSSASARTLSRSAVDLETKATVGSQLMGGFLYISKSH